MIKEGKTHCSCGISSSGEEQHMAGDMNTKRPPSNLCSNQPRTPERVNQKVQNYVIMSGFKMDKGFQLVKKFGKNEMDLTTIETIE